MSQHTAVVIYPSASRAEAAQSLVDLLLKAGFRATALYSQGSEEVHFGTVGLRGFSIRSWDEAKARAGAPRSSIGEVVQFKRLSETASIPSRGSASAAGLDLHYDGVSATQLSADRHDATGDVYLRPGDRLMLSTGIAFCPPEGCYGRVAPRSGLAVKGIDTSAGVIDADYTGEIKVILSLHREASPLTIRVGDRIAQLVLERCVLAEPVEVADLGDTLRGEGGFGSTGG